MPEVLKHRVESGSCTERPAAADIPERPTADPVPLQDDLETLVAERTLRLAATINQLEREAAERRSVENRLSVQGRFYQTILDKIVEGVFVTSRFDIITYCNESLLAALATESSDTPTGKHILIDFDGGDIIGALTPYYQSARRTADTVSFASVAIQVAHATRYYSGSMIPILENGQFNGMICTIRDVTLEKEYHETQQAIQTRLIQANKSNYLAFLVSGIDHEVNNPNNSIMLGSELLSLYWSEMCSFLDIYEEECGGGEAWSAYHELKRNFPPVVDGIRQSVHRIEKVMTALREVSGKKALAPTYELDLNNVVSVSVAILHHHINKFTNRFLVELGEDVPRIPGNAPQIIQVVINLLMNALQSLPDMERGVTISTGYDHANCTARLVIQDEGTGIHPDIRSKIFEPFFTTRLDQGGSGLGLPISQHILSDHNGTLQLLSSPGVGTTVMVMLPGKGRRQ